MLEALPELRGKYDDLLSWWGEGKPGNHVVAGLLLNPLLARALRSSDRAVLRRAFELLERMVTSEDDAVVNVAAVTVLEQIVTNPHLLRSASQHMGLRTSELTERVESWLRDFTGSG